MVFPIGNAPWKRWQSETVDHGRATLDDGDVSARKVWRNTSVKERVDFLFDEMGLGVRELARKTDFNPGQISKLRNEEEARGAMPETFWRLAHGAGVSYTWLSLGIGEPTDANALTDLDVAVRYHGAELAPGAVEWARGKEREGEIHAPKKWAAMMFLEQSKPKPVEPTDITDVAAKRDTATVQQAIKSAKRQAKKAEK